MRRTACSRMRARGASTMRVTGTRDLRRRLTRGARSVHAHVRRPTQRPAAAELWTGATSPATRRCAPRGWRTLPSMPRAVARGGVRAQRRQQRRRSTRAAPLALLPLRRVRPWRSAARAKRTRTACGQATGARRRPRRSACGRSRSSLPPLPQAWHTRLLAVLRGSPVAAGRACGEVLRRGHPDDASRVVASCSALYVSMTAPVCLGLLCLSRAVSQHGSAFFLDLFASNTGRVTGGRFCPPRWP